MAPFFMGWFEPWAGFCDLTVWAGILEKKPWSACLSMACLQPLLLSPNSGAASQKGQIGSRLSCNVDQKNPFRVCLVIRIVVFFTKLNQTKPCYSEAISLLSDFGVLKPWYSCSKQSRSWQAAENHMDCLNSPGKQATTLTMQLLQWTVNLVSILSVCQVFIVKIALGIRVVFLFVCFPHWILLLLYSACLFPAAIYPNRWRQDG